MQLAIVQKILFSSRLFSDERIITRSHVAIIGASPKPHRYAHKAQLKLLNKGHQVILVSPRYDVIEQHRVYPNIAAIDTPIDTITLYINPQLSADMMPDIIKLKPRRVIFNPGTESERSQQQLKQAGIETLEACTLVLLSTGQF